MARCRSAPIRANGQAGRSADRRRLPCPDQYAPGQARLDGVVCRGGGKDVVSRTWRKVCTDRDAWNKRDLMGEDIVRLILDGTVVRVASAASRRLSRCWSCSAGGATGRKCCSRSRTWAGRATRLAQPNSAYKLSSAVTLFGARQSVADLLRNHDRWVLVFAVGRRGITNASATQMFSLPITRPAGSATALGSWPILTGVYRMPHSEDVAADEGVELAVVGQDFFEACAAQHECAQHEATQRRGHVQQASEHGRNPAVVSDDMLRRLTRGEKMAGGTRPWDFRSAPRT